ncbi:GNAT family N-acetyltransferase [Mycolicibacterium hodleri]|uniref:GNAT family N-acetyltransferase n=1 Tax=Mycolicibacterium hodleri TaxID=49897 RepID=A0A502EIA0_9MYCO|nr:GNAT family N-acetyltransferase [Mycolicibacterium hodleri]TPG37207.1 GNAT family N-acetyltransferase [Mycolicibacterium hodleri]
MTDVHARSATGADVGDLSKTLGRAFYDDPVMCWMLPDADRRRRKLYKLFSALTRHHHLAHGGVEVVPDETGGIGGAALWDPPGRWRQTRGQELRAMPGLLLAFGRSLQRGFVLEEMMKEAHPEEPHWYLAIIGSDPDVRGKGYGHELMSSRLDRCDAGHAPAYLESSNPDNVPYYQRFGFEITGEITPPGGPSLIPMWRPAR